MRNLSVLILTLGFVLQFSFGWPSHGQNKRHSITHHIYSPINTGMIHNDCCKLDIKTNKDAIIEYAPFFIIEWQMFHFDNCYKNISCDTLPSENPKALNYSRKSLGVTYYDSQYRGGSQLEVFRTNCIPIFASFPKTNFSCKVYLIKEQNKAFVTTKKAPKQFGKCCILAAPFHPPEKNFTTKMNYGGKKLLGNKYYYEYALNLPEPDGLYVHSFWAEPTPENYYPQSFFLMVGVNNVLLYQQFKELKVKKFKSAKIFKIPKSCRSANVKPCPDFANNVRQF